MKAQIKNRAVELGFDACRITSANPPDSSQRFRDWLAADRNGKMAYLNRTSEKRLNPQRVLADAKSVVTLGFSYSTDRRPSHNGPQGLIARYAEFEDYHDIIADRLKNLSNYTIELGGAETRSLWYVDTGPILERDFAQRSGLGFVGKHTNLISRRLGNWMFLAEIITTLEIEADTPEKNRCGTCTRCLTACPTNAFTGPFELDARRCISYLTIELKGPIPNEFRTAIGNRIFGCDDCLEVCPWNRFAQEGSIMRNHIRLDLQTPGLLDLLSLDDTSFKQRFAGTPINRSKRRGFLRNVAVALGNVGDATALPALNKATSDPEPLIAEHAEWAIEQIESRQRNNSQLGVQGNLH